MIFPTSQSKVTKDTFGHRSLDFAGKNGGNDMEMTRKWHGNDPGFSWFYHPNFLDLPGSFLIPAATSGKILLGMILMSEPLNNESKPKCWIILCNVGILISIFSSNSWTTVDLMVWYQNWLSSWEFSLGLKSVPLPKHFRKCHWNRTGNSHVFLRSSIFVFGSAKTHQYQATVIISIRQLNSMFFLETSQFPVSMWSTTLVKKSPEMCL